MLTGIFILDYFQANPWQAVFFLVAIVIAVTVHEFAHAYVAARQGDATARYLGRVSLNPAAHLDPAGSFLFLVAGIGWGKPVPINPFNLRDGKLGDFYVSIAGIITNLVVAFIFAIPWRLVQVFGGDITSINAVWFDFANMVTLVNCLLAAFNLLPIPPLDGSRAIGIIIPSRFREAYEEYLRIGPVLLIGIFLLAIVLRINLLGWIIEPIQSLFLYLVRGFPNGLF